MEKTSLPFSFNSLGTVNSGEGASFLWPGCHSGSYSSTGRFKEHRLRHSLPPPLFLWHGLLALVSTNTHTHFSIISILHLLFPVWLLSSFVVNGLHWNNWNTRLVSCFLLHPTILPPNLCPRLRRLPWYNWPILHGFAPQLQWKHTAATAFSLPFPFALVFLFVLTPLLWKCNKLQSSRTSPYPKNMATTLCYESHDYQFNTIKHLAPGWLWQNISLCLCSGGWSWRSPGS